MAMKASISTPDLGCITDDDKESVYEPAEDTFLLLDALESDQELVRCLRPSVVLEIGCGSGVVSVFVSKLLGTACPALILCTDVNCAAANLARRLALHNHQQIEIVLTDLAFCFGDQLKNKVDVLIFNPPYVVTPSEEVGTNDLSASWAGGVDGREVLDRLLPNINEMLAPQGLFYLVAIKENKIDEISSVLLKYGLAMSVVLQRRSGSEQLVTLRFERIK